MPKGSKSFVDMTSQYFQLVPREQQEDIPSDISDDASANVPAYADEFYSPTSKKESLLAPPHQKKNKKNGLFLTQQEIVDILDEAWRWDDDSYDVDFLCSAMGVICSVQNELPLEEQTDCRRVLSFCSDDESC